MVRLLQQKLPKTRVLLIGLLPRQNEWFRGRVARINAGIAQLDDGARMRFIDVDARFSRAPGTIIPDVYQEGQFHLVRKGYETWARRSSRCSMN